MSAQPLFKIATRFYPPIAFEMGYVSQVKRMPELFGFGMSNIVVRFDGKKMDVFRVLEDMERMREPAIAFARSPAFSEGVVKFEEDVAVLIKMAADDATAPASLIEIMANLYPYSAISFFLTGVWEASLPEAQKADIVATCIRYREPADHMMSAYLGFFERLLAKCELSVLTPLAVVSGEDPARYTWMEKGFVFSDNQFFDEPWDGFLARRGYAHEEELITNTTRALRGMTAHPGIAQGTVRVVWSPRDMATFQEGEILVTSMTTPSFLSAIKKAGAIVTDEGGVTCHAAIVARELKKPCVIGTKNATKILKDGDVVEVDATKGVVRKIS